MTEVDPYGTSDDATLGLCVSKTLGVTDSSKLGEEIDSKEGSCIGVPE